MATYTIELGRLISTGFDIGLTDYPTPKFCKTSKQKSDWRSALNKKIVSHYQFHEICAIPPERFKVFLNNTMNEIMPKMCLLYDALNEDWSFYTGTSLMEVINDSQNDATSETIGRNTQYSGEDKNQQITSDRESTDNYNLIVGSDMPGQMLNIESVIASNTYASTAQKNKSNGSTTGNSTTNGTTTYGRTEKHDETRENNKGMTGKRERTLTGISSQSYAKLFKEYAENIRNLDAEVIYSLNDCFMGIL